MVHFVLKQKNAVFQYVLTYEAGEALRFEPIAINAGVLGVLRVMQELGMHRPSRKKVARVCHC